jgi:hypothetical protein
MYNYFMLRLLKISIIFPLIFTFALAGCDTEPEAYSGEVFSYKLGALNRSAFYSDSSTMTMNEWHSQTSRTTGVNYSKSFYKDKQLTTSFKGSDIVNAETTIHIKYDWYKIIYPYFGWDNYNPGKKTGEVTGTVTLTDIPSVPATVTISIVNSGISAGIDIREVAGSSSSQVGFSFRIYENDYINFGSTYTFRINVLINESGNSFTRSISTGKTISGANANIGNVGSVNIKTVTMSGTINVTYDNGKTVPYVEIIALYDVDDEIGIAGLLSPGPDTPWSITVEAVSTSRDIQFQVMGYSKSNPSNKDFIFDAFVPDSTIYISNNDYPNITINLGDQ